MSDDDFLDENLDLEGNLSNSNINTPNSSSNNYSMSLSLVIVESPGKIKKIKSYLGSNYIVMSSIGHIMDLPIKTLGINLDTLEESDDEEEFQNENIDKFVYLDKSYKMICNYNNKFKKWTPIKLSEDKNKVITNEELKNIYMFYEQNRKRYN